MPPFISGSMFHLHCAMQSRLSVSGTAAGVRLINGVTCLRRNSFVGSRSSFTSLTWSIVAFHSDIGWASPSWWSPCTLWDWKLGMMHLVVACRKIRQLVFLLHLQRHDMWNESIRWFNNLRYSWCWSTGKQCLGSLWSSFYCWCWRFQWLLVRSKLCCKSSWIFWCVTNVLKWATL